MSWKWGVHRAVGVVVAAALVSVAGCGDGAEVSSSLEPVPAVRPSQGLDESVWLALTGEPRLHLVAARRAQEADRLEEAADHLRAAESMMRLEATSALGAHVRQRLEGAALAVGEAGRQAQGGTLSSGELERVTARALLATAEHHRELAVAAFGAHRPALGGIHTAEAARGLRHAYGAAGFDIDRALGEALEAARVAAERVERDGSEVAAAKADSTLVALGHHAVRLENALGALRR